MAARCSEAASVRVQFEVDGVRIGVPSWHWYPHRWAGGAFTADYERVRRMVPSPPLFPVRVSRNRALVCVSGAHIAAAGYQPPFFGFGEVALVAFVTRGEQPAPPLVPGLGRRAMDRYGFGFFPVMMLVTNRVAAEVYRMLLGIRAAVAAVRVEQRSDYERFRCEADGRLVCDLAVWSDGRASSADPGVDDSYYAVEDGEVFRIPVGGSGISRSRYGWSAATLQVGDHPLADRVRRLELARSWAGEFSPDRHMRLAGSAESLGPAGAEIRAPTSPDGVLAGLMVSPTPGVEFAVDQGVDRLGWRAEGVFTGPTLHDRAR